MVDVAIDNLMTVEEMVPTVAEQSVDKKQKMLECIASGNSKLYLGKVYTEEQITKLTDEQICKLFTLYENKLSAQMVKSLGRSIINVYSMAACSLLKIENQQELSNDLEADPFLNSALQRLTCDLYYRFGSFLAPVSVCLITGRHYVKNILHIKNRERTNNTSDLELPQEN
jgi:hypothetical protein